MIPYNSNDRRVKTSGNKSRSIHGRCNKNELEKLILKQKKSTVKVY